ncbi:MAG: DUF3426 domain-containing protein [Thermodesulfobacteriota bacterium]
MIVQCDNCETSFKLEDAKVPPDGAWVRCGKCQEVFHVDSPAPARPAAAAPAAPRAPEPDFFELSEGPAQAARAAESAEFGLEMDDMMAGRDRAKGGRGLKIVFWLLVLPLLLALLAVGGLFALDRFQVMPQVVDPFRNLPGLNLILGKPAPAATAPAAGGVAAPAAPQAEAKPPAKPADTGEYRGLKLSQVRGYFRMNQKSGKLFVIQGMVLNDEGQARAAVMVRGRLNDTQGKTAQQAVIYAGKAFTSEQLQELPFEDIKAGLAKPEGDDGRKAVITAGGNLPFMIVFADLPSNLAEFTAEVVGSEPAPAPPQSR